MLNSNVIKSEAVAAERNRVEQQKLWENGAGECSSDSWFCMLSDPALSLMYFVQSRKNCVND